MADKDAMESLKTIELGIIAKAIPALNKTNQKLKAKLLREHLAGPGDNSLAKRSGNLARSITEEAATPEAGGTMISAKLHAGMNYAKTHFGPRGSSITIKPTGGRRFLTIPTDFARTNAGVAKGRMQNVGGKWTFLGMTTFIQKGVIFGYAEGANRRSEGMRQRRAAGQSFTKTAIIPLFILKSSVVVKRRIDPMIDMIQWAKPVLAEELKKAGLFKVG
jgi:hypothetical protein